MTRTVLRTPGGQERLQIPDGRGGTMWVRPEVEDINNQGQVVGGIWTDFGTLVREPLLWEGESRATVLPTDPGASDMALFVNDAGQVVIAGRATDQDPTRNRLWDLDDGTTTELPTGYAYVDFNERGQLLLDEDDGSIGVWEEGRVTTIPPPADAGWWHSFELSDAGHVVGHSASQNLPIPGCSEYDHQPFIWHQGTMTRPPIQGTTEAVNRSGAMAVNETGYCTSSVDALVWANGTTRDLGRMTRARDINDRGQVVGQAGQASYLWDDGRLTDLGSLGGGATFANQINERGQVIGTSRTADGATHGFVWTSGRMLDLGRLDLGDALVARGPLDINDRGQIIGYDIGDPDDPDDTTAVLWQVHDPAIDDPGDPGDPGDPPDDGCVTATNAAHVEAGRATSWVLFTWAAGTGTYLGPTSRTTSLREIAPGRWDLVDTC